MFPDAPSVQPPESTSKARAFNAFSSLSRRAFLKAFLAFFGLFSLARYFKGGVSPSLSDLGSSGAPAAKALPDGRTVAYTAKPPPQTTNA